METKTSFDLNQQLHAWRENLGQSPAFQRENLDELEAHLRDSIGRLQGAGLSVEEAFMVAAKRVGTGGSLAAEYEKVNRQTVWLDRMFWMLVGLQLWRFVNGFLNQVAAVFFTVTGYLNNLSLGVAGRPAQVVLSLSNLAAMAASLWLCWWLIMRKGPAAADWISRSSGRKIILVVAGLFIGVLTLDHLANFITTIFILKHDPHRLTAWNPFLTLVSSIIQSVILFLVTVGLARQRLSLRKAG